MNTTQTLNERSLPAVIRRDIPDAKLPAVYIAARQALAECVRIDECKDWSDKAAALASYARQAKNTILEAHAKRIRLRALERAGELLLEIKPALSGGSKSKGMGRYAAGRAAGMPAPHVSAAMRLAGAPQRVRDSLIEGSSPPGNICTVNRPGVLPRRRAKYGGRMSSDSYSLLMGVGGSSGLSSAFSCLKKIPYEAGKNLAGEELTLIRARIVEIRETLDKIERNLPKVRK